MQELLQLCAPSIALRWGDVDSLIRQEAKNSNLLSFNPIRALEHAEYKTAPSTVVSSAEAVCIPHTNGGMTTVIKHEQLWKKLDDDKSALKSNSCVDEWENLPEGSCVLELLRDVAVCTAGL